MTPEEIMSYISLKAEIARLTNYAEICRQDADRWREHAQQFAKERDELKAEIERLNAIHAE